MNACGKHGWTPLHAAVANRRKRMVELLLASGANVNAKDKNGETPTEWAARAGRQDMVQFLKGLIGKAPRPAPEADKVGWAKAANGLQSRIVLPKRRFRQGEAIAVGLEIRNVGDKPIHYDGRSFGRIHILTPEGKPPPDIQHYFQTASGVGERPPLYKYPVLKPSQSLHVGPFRRDQNEYLGTPGVYRVTWPGVKPRPPDVERRSHDAFETFGAGRQEPGPPMPVPPHVRALPPAPEATFEVVAAPCGGPAGDLVGRALRVLPPGWRINGAFLLEANVRVAGHDAGRGSRLKLVHSPTPGLLVNRAYVRLAVTANRLPRLPKPDSYRTNHLGHGTLGHVYLTWGHRKPRTRWQHAAHDIAKALGVAPPPARPPGPDWGRMLSRILWACHERRKESEGLRALCEGARLEPQEGDAARLVFRWNLAPASKARPWARKNPKRPYYDVALVVGPRREPGQRQPSLHHRWLNGDSRDFAGAPVLKKLGLEIMTLVASDDATFRRAVRAIFQREILLALTGQLPPTPRPPGEPPGARPPARP